MKASTLMQMALLISQESTCCSWKVGAVIEKDGEILGTGYNGTPSGHEHCVDVARRQGWVNSDDEIVSESARADHSSWSNKNEVHAEVNAIISAAKAGRSLVGAKMYVTVSPCEQCAKAIANSGIRHVIFLTEYDRGDGTWSNILTTHDIVKVTKFNTASMKHINWSNIKIQTKIL